MRPWLVVIGASFLLVGGGAAAALIAVPPPSAQEQSTTALVGHTIGPVSNASFPFAGAPGRTGTVSVTWSSSAPVSATLEQLDSPACPNPCVAHGLHSWGPGRSGTYSWHGALGPEYELTWSTGAGEYANVSATAVVTWTVPFPITATTIAAEVASGLLAALGGVGLFLGLFLRGGFRGPARIVSRGPDDAADVAGATDPRTASPGGGSEPPRRGPPSRSA